jgi:DNA-binding beta-propeller fold protein YncE
MTIDSTNVYWGNYGSGTVMKVSLAGGTPTQLVSGVTPWDVAVDPVTQNLYFTNFSAGDVMSVPVAGGTLVTLAAGQSDPARLVVDSTNVFWTDQTTTGFVMTVSK